jgi:hypothetical protein
VNEAALRLRHSASIPDAACTRGVRKFFRHDMIVDMRKKALKDILGRVEAWPKEAQEAAFDSLSAIEADRYEDPALAEDIIRSREDIKHDRVTSQSDLIKELHLFGN